MPGTTDYGPKIERLRSPLALARAVAGFIATAVSQGVRRNGRASLSLPWNRVNIVLSDVRWVDEGSPHATTAMLRRTFFSQSQPAPANFIPLKNAAATANQGVTIARSGLRPREERYDLVLQGAAKLEILNHSRQSADALQTPFSALRNVGVFWCP